MAPVPCSFCQHVNPDGAKFCNECGGVLRLRPCEHCEAINDGDAIRCHQCGRDLAGASPPVIEASSAEVRSVGELVPSVARALETLEADLATLRDCAATPEPLPPTAVRLHPFRRTSVTGTRSGEPVRSHWRSVAVAAGLIAIITAVVHVYRPVPDDAASAAPVSATTGKGGETSAPAPSVAPPPIPAATQREASPASVANAVRPAATTTNRAASKHAAPPRAAPAVADRRAAANATESGSLKSAPRRTARTAAQPAGSTESRRAATPITAQAAGTAPPPYRVPAGECTAGVVALGLCASADSSGGR